MDPTCPGDACAYTFMWIERTLREWEVVGVWAAVVATVAAVGVALWFGLTEQRRANAEARTQANDAADRAKLVERAQAEAVAAWITTAYDEGQPSGSVHIRNASQLPIWKVHVEWWWIAPQAGEERRTIDLKVLIPGAEHVERSVHIAYQGPQDLLEITFTDAAGRRWVRRVDGLLARA